MWYLLTILIAVIGVTSVNGSCKTCNLHGYACVNSNQFGLCKDGGTAGIADDILDESVLYTCDPGYICTDIGVLCALATSTAPLGCEDGCSVCAAGKSFTCTSRTTFAVCSGTTPTTITGTCPPDFVCDTSGTNICIEKCKLPGGYVCDKPATTPPTVAPPTVSPPTVAPPVGETPNQVCAAQNTVGRFPYTGDTACLTYVYCRYSGSSLMGIASVCPTGHYFNKSIQDCQATKPVGCV